MDGADDNSALRAEIDQFLQKGGLSEGAPLRRLFEFLAEWSLAKKPVAEIDIAIEVFHKSGTDPGDASVRVYIHRLRRKLEEYYDRLGSAAANRLVIPRGEYRLALADNIKAAPGPAEKSVLSRRAAMAAGLSAFGLASAGAGAAVALKGPWTSDPYAAVRRSSLWAGMAQQPRSIIVVLGDYYIFGETDGRGGIARMVREFPVNSQLDLDQFLMDHPEKIGRYVDLDLTYLPLGAALSLTNVLPFLKTIALNGQLRTITASEYAPDLLKTNHLVYVGYLSGLGPLENTVFTGSRFGVGETYPPGTKIYDEIVDRSTRLVYPTQIGLTADNKAHHDYGYIAGFASPSGTRLVVLSGTRDVGVMQSADVATDPSALAGLAHSVGGSRSLEAVYQVTGVGRTNMMGQLQISARRQDMAGD